MDADAELAAVLAELADPARYRRPAEADLTTAPPPSTPLPEPGQLRRRSHVAAELAQALTGEAVPEPAPEPAAPAGEVPSGPGAALRPAVGDHRGPFPLLRAPASLAVRSGGPTAEAAARYLAHSADLSVSGGPVAALAAPLAVSVLAGHVVLRRVAGSSTASVAAAWAAAAELGRTCDAEGSGFAGLAALAGRLDSPWPADLLQPPAAARPLHRLVAAASQGRRLPLLQAVAAVLSPGERRTVGLTVAGALVGAAGVLVALGRGAHVPAWALAVVAGPLLVTFGLAAGAASALVAWPAVRRAAALPFGGASDGGWGLLDGVSGPGEAVADAVDDLAGVPAATGGAQRYALTFGDLWLGRIGVRTAADERLLRRAAADPSVRAVDLLLATTDLAAGRPRLLPFGVLDRPEQQDPGPDLLCCRSCLAQAVPERVADQTVLLSAGPSDATCPQHPGAPLHRLPPPWDLPVALAVRLSAAAPGVVRAVPLYALGPADDVRTHWCCDGAASGGLPARALDAVLPRWPTVTLTGAPASPDAGGADVPDTGAAAADRPYREVGGVAAWAGAVLGTPGTAADALRAQDAGRRGTVARLGSPAPSAAALRAFLAGDAEALRPLVREALLRGHAAGTALLARLTGPDGDLDAQARLDRFRWARLRDALAGQRQQALAFGAGVPLYTDLALAYRVPAEAAGWFSPPLVPGSADPAWGDAVAAVTHLRSLVEGGVLDWDTDWGAPPADPHRHLG